jgi:methylthioribose-1-phosphate isomerase
MMNETIRWAGNHIEILDQTLLPAVEAVQIIMTVDQLINAIQSMKIRGAPALGIAGGMGVAIAANSLPASLEHDEFFGKILIAREKIVRSRPTAVNLQWGADRVFDKMKKNDGLSVARIQSMSVEEAEVIRVEDEDLCRRIGENGVPLIRNGTSVLTHCNTGSLATGGIGTALGVIKTAFRKGVKLHVFVDETRPLLQGSRLTAWELKREGIPHTLICDNMAGFLMRQGRIHCAIVGADRIAINGDTANKIGTYTVAAMCHFHGIPFYVAAPFSTIDLSLPDGSSIPIEERDADEVSKLFGKSVAPPNTTVCNPAFDVTPSKLISAIITEKQIHYGPHYLFSS